MLTDNSKINGLTIRTEIRVPRADTNSRWVSSVVVCQDDRGRFVVWSVWQENGLIEASNGSYDIDEYERALNIALARVRGAL
jgi:hypothetical protein